jgi:hypothetical protein
MNETIRHFKLTSGDEIITEVIDRPRGGIMCRKPMMITQRPFRQIYMLQPYMASIANAAELVLIQAHAVVASCKPSEDLIAEYHNFVQYYENIKHMPVPDAKEIVNDMLKRLQEDDSVPPSTMFH